jgi:N-acylneuraminate cytidylyltransferase
MVVSVFLTKSNPYFVLYEKDKDGFLAKSKTGQFQRRQDCPPVYQLNGAIYLLNTQSIDKFTAGNVHKIMGYQMEEKHSLDLDTEIDWAFAEFALQNGFIPS